ncbi:hypothetical protein LguiA_035224 [Lonicera macranthoides]
MASRRLLLLRRLSRAVKKPPPPSIQRSCIYAASSSYSVTVYIQQTFNYNNCCPLLSIPSRNFCSRPSNLNDFSQGPAPIDYRSLLEEDEFHQLADSTIHDLLEKMEEYGDSVEIDGFDIDYGNQVLTVKLGCLGSYVLNKQTPNRQIWMSSPVR